MKIEQQIKEEIATLRESGASNDELIREAIHQIFYHIGETPTQARVLDMVRSPGKSPGATTVQARLNAFWVDLRKRTNTPLSCPDVPPDVLAAFERTVPNLWLAAQTAAQDSLAVFRQEAESEVAEARTLAAQARSEVETLADMARAAAQRESKAVEQAGEMTRLMNEANQSRESTERDLAACHAAHSETLTQIEEWKKEAISAKEETEHVRKEADAREDRLRAEYDLRVAKLHKEMSKLESLLTASQETVGHLRVEIDREVSQSERQRAEADAAKAALADARITHNKEMSALRAEVTTAHLLLAENKGRLDAVIEERERALVSLSAALRRIAMLEREIGFVGPRQG